MGECGKTRDRPLGRLSVDRFGSRLFFSRGGSGCSRDFLTASPLKNTTRFLPHRPPHSGAAPGARVGPAGGRRTWCPAPSCAHVAQRENVAMRNLDVNSLWRSTIGFDRLFNLIDE